MSLTGKSTLSLRKKDVQQQKQAGATYRRVVFAHKASAGETGINLTALAQPSEMAALGFTNPSTSDLLAANMLFYKKNLTIISSARGTLMQDLSYTIPTSQRIEFQGFTALQDEIFTCLLETAVRDGQNIVDASPIIATGELAIGNTDFNVGVPFESGKYSAQQIGAVLVFRDGVIQFRNTNNGTTGGNYQEVDGGNGLATIIRFNDAPVSEASSIVVWGNLLAERPDGSMMAAIESLAGQLDQMIPTLAALAGVPTTTFQGAPNSQDLRAFGDRVQALEELTENIPTIEERTQKIAAIYENVAGTGVGGLAPTVVPFPTLKYETSASLLSGGVFTCTEAGLYDFSCCLFSVTTINSSSAWYIQGRKNGATLYAQDAKAGTGAANTSNTVKISGVVDLMPGDTFAIYSFTDTGVAVSLVVSSGVNVFSIARRIS